MRAIDVDGLWKQYRYGSVGYGTLRHDLQNWWARRRGRDDPNRRLDRTSTRRGGRGSNESFWALEDVSFGVETGEVVGIVGRNGAGKSTLLKTLSRVTAPTRGEIRLRGRVASLLEVGTGFHPELTGRENVYLNGAILGMTRAEVRQRFDAIVAFSGVDDFIDTPVKRFSSGMYLRLAFAVAAHLEADILLVDEVLAVGDQDFQRRCLTRLDAVAGEGRTVLFVSHNLGAVASLCRRAVQLERGRIAAAGETSAVLEGYAAMAGEGAFRVSPESSASDRRLLEVRVEPEAGTPDAIPVDAAVAIRMLLDVDGSTAGLEVSARIERWDGQRVFTTNASDCDASFRLEEGRTELTVVIPPMLLAPGTFHATVAVHRPNVELLEYHERIAHFTIVETGSTMWRYAGVDHGSVLVKLPWYAEHLSRPSARHER